MEMWCLNNGHICFTEEQNKRFTGWFQIHPRSDFEANNVPVFGHLKFLQTCGIPVYMEQVWEDIPTSVRYPRSEIVSSLGFDYFTSSMAYMLALAIYQGYQEVRLYGIDMAADSEYRHERPCLEFWLGYAHARGISIIFPEDCPILKGKDYGHTVQLSSTFVNKMLRMHDQEREVKRAQFNEATGRVHMLEDLLKTTPEDTRLKGALEDWRLAMVQRCGEFNACTGAVEALTNLMIEALRPENEETRRLRSMVGDILNPGYIPVRTDGAVPGLR
jgi:hypothetical protein